MAVLIGAISIVIKAEKLLSKYPGGWERFRNSVPNQTLCADGEIVRVSFMSPHDVRDYILKLESLGLVFQKDNIAQDLAVVDQQKGITTECPWLEFGRIPLKEGSSAEVSACRLKNSKLDQLLTPDGWTYENSLSAEFVYVPSENAGNRMVHCKTEGGVETYIDLTSGKNMYSGRVRKQ